MATGIDTYQGLMRESMSPRIRRLASQRLGQLEGAVAAREGQRQLVEGLMRHEPSGDGRGTPEAPMSGAGVVTATTVRASDRQRIRDGHDARPGLQRGSVRNFGGRDNPYGSDGAMREDIPLGVGLSPADRCSGVVTYRVPVWAVEIEGSERRRLGRGFRETAAVTERDLRERAPKRTARSVQDAAYRRHQLLKRAGTIRMADQD